MRIFKEIPSIADPMTNAEEKSNLGATVTMSSMEAATMEFDDQKDRSLR